MKFQIQPDDGAGPNEMTDQLGSRQHKKVIKLGVLSLDFHFFLYFSLQLHSLLASMFNECKRKLLGCLPIFWLFCLSVFS